MKQAKYIAYVGLLIINACATTNNSENGFEATATDNASEKIASTPIHSLDNLRNATEDSRTWRHVQSSITLNRKSPIYGFRNTYANDKAIQGLKVGTYENGAVFATYIYELDMGNVEIIPGEKIKFGFTTKDATATKTGGWIFSAFGADGIQRKIDQFKACFNACHVKAKDKGYVLSTYAE